MSALSVAMCRGVYVYVSMLNISLAQVVCLLTNEKQQNETKFKEENK